MKTLLTLTLLLESIFILGCAQPNDSRNANYNNDNPATRADTESGSHLGPNNGGTNFGPTNLGSGAPPGGDGHLPGN